MKKPDSYSYPAVFVYKPDQAIAVIFPDLGAATSGENDADALRAARELLGLHLFGLEDDGDPIPPPSPLSEIQAQVVGIRGMEEEV